MRLNKKGFTLVELIVVIVIIGILAAIAAPSMTANTARAKRQEAIAAMGAIRTAYRLYTAEYAVAPGGIADLNTAKYISNAELNGPNYVIGDYDITGNLISANSTKIGSADGNCNMNLITGTIGNP